MERKNETTLKPQIYLSVKWWPVKKNSH